MPNKHTPASPDVAQQHGSREDARPVNGDKQSEDNMNTNDGDSLMSSLSRFYSGDEAEESSQPSSALASLLRTTSSGLLPKGIATVGHPQTAPKAASSSLSSSLASGSSSGKEAKYCVTAFYAAQFDAFRQLVCDRGNNGAAAAGTPISSYIASLCRCLKWKTRGGKSNAYFAKTMDDRFVVKQLSKSELQSFLDFAPQYFRYVGESMSEERDTCLAKIMGVYQITVKIKGKEQRLDAYVMENVMYNRNLETIYDLKGSMRSRYTKGVTGKSDAGGSVVLMDENLVEVLSADPILLDWKAHKRLMNAIHNDTKFLSQLNVMDYSLLVGVDAQREDLVVGIIDFIRQYTWDKQLETWAKSSGIVGGTSKGAPTVTSPVNYMERFRKQMGSYFRIMPDRWTPVELCQGYASTPSSKNAGGS